MFYVEHLEGSNLKFMIMGEFAIWTTLFDELLCLDELQKWLDGLNSSMVTNGYNPSIVKQRVVTGRSYYRPMVLVATAI